MFSASNKILLAAILVFFTLGFFSFAAVASTGAINVVASGKDLPEAMKNALRQAISSNFMKEKGSDKQLIKNILETEVLSAPAQFVSSYKILEGGTGGFLNLNASVETDVIRALLSFIPSTFGLAAADAKVLLLVRSTGLPTPTVESAIDNALELVIRERLVRRKFQVLEMEAGKELSAFNEDFSLPENIKPLGDKMGAALSVAFRLQYESVENENSHVVEDRIFVNATIFNHKNNKILSRYSNSILMPKLLKKESMSLDWPRVAAEEGGAFFQEMLMKSGDGYSSSEALKEGQVLRIMNAPNFQAVNKVRLAIEGMKDVKQILESSIKKGMYDFSIKTNLEKAVLQKKILSLSLEDVEMKVADPIEENSAIITLELKQKPTPASQEAKEVTHE